MAVSSSVLDGAAGHFWYTFPFKESLLKKQSMTHTDLYMCMSLYLRTGFIKEKLSTMSRANNRGLIK